MLQLSEGALSYRFGGLTADYVVCGTCGVYVGAVAEIGGSLFATLNLNSFEDPQPRLEAAPVFYDAQDAATKAERRQKLWTPARLLRI